MVVVGALVVPAVGAVVAVPPEVAEYPDDAWVVPAVCEAGGEVIFST